MSKRRKAPRLVPFLLVLHSYAEHMVYQSSYLHEQIADLRTFEKSREAREAQERADYEANNPKIQQQFADLKRGLASMSEEDWSNLPEPGDLTRRNKRARTNAHQRFYAVPDSVIAGARDSTELGSTVTDDSNPTTNGSGTDNADGTMTNFQSIGAARGRVLTSRLDQAEQSGTDTASGTATNIDPKGYLTSLTKSEMKAGEVEVGDVNRVRVLLDSAIKTNPKHAPGWIAAARLEEVASRIVAARNVVARGCALVPSSVDLWKENIRLNTEGDNHNARIIAAKAIEQLPNSTELWKTASELETDPSKKKRVLRKALDMNPKSTVLWKLAVNLEDLEGAKLLLSSAIKEVPLSVELHLALARLENPENSMKVLNKARALNPASHEIWLAAVTLQESLSQPPEKIRSVMKRAVQSLAQQSAMLGREEWIAAAERCEADGLPLSCAAVLQETLSYGLDPNDEDLKAIFLSDAESSINRERYETARAIYAYLLRLFPTSKSGWAKALELEKNHGTREAYWQLLEKSCEACPQAEEFWLLNARSKWEAGQLDESRKVLARAFNQLGSNSENIFLSAVKLEADHGEINQARGLLQQARQEAGTDRIWYKSVAFERTQGNDSDALDLCIAGLLLYPRQPRLHMQKGQIYVAMGKLPQAREAYNIGTRACPSSVPLYLLLSRLEEKQGLIVKARSVLERGFLSTKSAEIALEQVKVEFRANNLQQAKVLMAKALQTHGTSGRLWSFSIWNLEPRTQRKPRSLEAIKKVDNDSTLFVTVARVFWGERKLEKAANWFEKAILLDADQGDTWAWYLKFLSQHGTAEKANEVTEKCKGSEPKHGEVWQAVAKDPANAGLGIEGVLKKVVALLD